MTEKSKRGSAKSAVTREINNIRRFIAEDDTEAVEECLPKVKALFKDFESAHTIFHDALSDDTELDESDLYYYEVQNNYIECLMSTKSWLKRDQNTVKQEHPDDNSTSSLSSLGQREFLALMNLPKVKLEPYNGDPLKYHSFFTVFDENVENVSENGGMKLTRLLQYTTGKAKEAMRACSLIGGDDGYAQARKLLHSRFGNNHLIAEKSGQEHQKGETCERTR